MGEILVKSGVIRYVLSILLILIVVLSFAGCAKINTMERIKEKKVIVMGTNAEFEPFEYRNEKGEVDGFDVAMAKKIAQEIGVELKIEDMAFDSLLNALKSGKIDFVAAAMTVKPDRLKNADFSEPYYKAAQRIIIRKDNSTIKSKNDLKGKKLGVQEGTTGDLVASEIEGTTVNRFKKALDAVLDLKNGKIDAVVVDESPAQVFVNKNNDLIILEEKLTDEDYAIAVRKGDEELLGIINKAIKQLKDSGEYDQLVSKYIGD